ncbi:diguanylate cyclase [Aureimonas endophytica]|uniref:diguanylate cyclase n=1 Tax=Aureimonas endophytica TaxID=2027858 RepID=A0A917E372_9HYPH|nr:GGDEF domain-containing protein [Aureimonas endophytica]GGD96289.1 diguanylate cyclase [Aureimonas endophytica]
MDADMFEIAPIPLWLEDWSGVRRLLREWGVADEGGDPRAVLRADPARARACAEAIRILKVNAETLALFEARDLTHLTENLGLVFQGEMLDNLIEEIGQLAEGSGRFVSSGINHTLSGRRLDMQIRGRLLDGAAADWHRLLVATEDVTAREAARRDLAESERHARGLFEHSPVSLWVEDFSSIRALIEDVRQSGVSDFPTFLEVHPEFVTRCLAEIHVLDVNRQTLQIFGAADKAMLLAHTGDIFRDKMREAFREQLIDLWNGKLFQSREVLNYSLAGEELHFVMQFSVLPGHETDWARVQVALTDITARKKAEAYLEYLGKHDVLTKLYNRSFFVDELNRLERRAPPLLTVIVADLDGLKEINDEGGHAAGDAILRRAGEVIAEAAPRPAVAARIGGDEFALLLPGTGEAEAAGLIQAIGELVEINNQFYPGDRLRLSLGAATRRPGERLEEAVRRADEAMYAAKRAYYAETGIDRRGRAPSGA